MILFFTKKLFINTIKQPYNIIMLSLIAIQVYLFVNNISFKW